MTRLPHALRRRHSAVILFAAGALALGACSGAGTESWLGAGASPNQASGHVLSRSNPLTVVYSFQKIYDKGTQNEATSIDDENEIVGTYIAGGQYNSFDQPCPKKSSYVCGAPVPADYNNSLGKSLATYLNGSNNSNGPHIDDVGYVTFSSPPKGFTCTTCGAVYDWDPGSNSGTWTLIEDPNDTSCGVTELMGINGSKITVGYYEVKQSNGCVKKAFEEYEYNGAPVFVNFSVAGTTNAIATGINNFGDVVGSATPESGACSGAATEGWYYTDFNYQTFCVASSANTQALSLNDNDAVVGSYADKNGTHGYIVTALTTSTPNYMPIVVQIGTSSADKLTIVNSLNTEWAISGQYEDGKGNLYGFLGTCAPSNCPVPNPPMAPRSDGASSGRRP